MDEFEKINTLDGEESIKGTPQKDTHKRSIFEDEKIKAEETLQKKRQLATKGDIKRIKQSSFKYEGKKVVTDDVKKLKSLEVEPSLSKTEKIDSYVEPVWIEYYVPKDSRFITELRYLYIPLIDPPFDERYPILNEHIKKNRFFDVINILNEHPEHTSIILESYHELLPMHEKVSFALRDARNNPESYKTAFFLCETIMKFEPTLAYLEVLGDYISWNLNWLIRKLNEFQIPFSAEDDTIAYLIKRRNIYWEENQLPYDERFEILAALFYDQAYPNRGLTIEEQDFFYNIFNK